MSFYQEKFLFMFKLKETIVEVAQTPDYDPFTSPLAGLKQGSSAITMMEGSALR